MTEEEDHAGLITRDGIIATLEPVSPEVESTTEENRTVPKPGSLTGFWMAPDFDEPLEDFKEYME
jgi:hypothetical protein